MREARKFVLELIISDHPLDCMTCEATGDCRLQDLAYEYEVKGDEYTGGVQHDYPIDDPNPFIQVDRNKCILCRRCVRACSHINGVEAIGIVYRGFKARIAFGMDSTMEDSPCEFCGSCVEVCPVAALWPKMSLGKGRAWQLQKTETTCSYCGVGCRLNLHVRNNEIVKVTAADGPANHGFSCVKGRFGYDYVNHADRLSKPLVRRYLLEGGTKDQRPETKDGRCTCFVLRPRSFVGIRRNRLGHRAQPRRPQVRRDQADARRRCVRGAGVGPVHQRGELPHHEAGATGDANAQC